MSGSASEISAEPKGHDNQRQGQHLGYVYDSNAEKQSTLFELCTRTASASDSYLLYLTGKQGVKGIRLSLKDVGFDVAQYEKMKQFKIVDSEDWFLTGTKQRLFKTNEELEEQLLRALKDAKAAGVSHLTVIAETDSLVRKGFYAKYKEFDQFLSRSLPGPEVTFVCAYDLREVEAQGVKDARNEIAKNHTGLL